MKIQLLDKRLPKPKPATIYSAGIDLHACIDTPLTLLPGDSKKLNSGIKVAIPTYWYGEMHIRSSIGMIGLNLMNSVGIIDSDYRGEIMIPVYNRSNIQIAINPMQRIAQLVISQHLDYGYIQVVKSLDVTERGEGGFGHTGE